MMEVQGIKCDNINCNFEDMSVPMTEYKSYVNKPCPKCKSNLLTENDYKVVMRMHKIFNNPLFKFLNKIVGFFSKSKPKDYELKFDGTSNYVLKELPTEVKPDLKKKATEWNIVETGIRNHIRK